MNQNNSPSQTATARFPYPRWVVFQLLEKCNLRCSMCYEWGKGGAYHDKEVLAQLDLNIVKKVITDCSPGKPYFELFGGEPLMYPQVDEILFMMKHYGCHVDIPTNGTLLETFAEMLVENGPRRIWVSIDGPEDINDRQRGAGVYRKALRGIKKLYEVRENKGVKNPMIGITMVVTPLNYLHVESFFLQDMDLSIIDWVSIEFQLYTTSAQWEKYAATLKTEFGTPDAPHAKGLIREKSDFAAMNIAELIRQVNSVRNFCKTNGIQIIGYPKTMDGENLQNFYTAQWDKMIDKRNRCSFPWLYMEISATGNVAPCHTFYDFTVGNIYDENVLDIWRGERFEAFRKFMKKNMLPVCSACSRYYSDL